MPNQEPPLTDAELRIVRAQIAAMQELAVEVGFSQVGEASVALSEALQSMPEVNEPGSESTTPA